MAEMGNSNPTEPEARQGPAKPMRPTMPQEIRDFFFKVVLPWQIANLPVKYIRSDPMSWSCFTRGWVEGRLGNDIGLDLSQLETDADGKPVIPEIIENPMFFLDLSNDGSTISNSSLVTFSYSSDENETQN